MTLLPLSRQLGNYNQEHTIELQYMSVYMFICAGIKMHTDKSLLNSTLLGVFSLQEFLVNTGVRTLQEPFLWLGPLDGRNFTLV